MADLQQLLQLMILVNYLQLKAFKAENLKTLAFIIVNDTHKVFKYERAFLWEFDEGTPKMIAVSGHHTVYKETELLQKSTKLLRNLKDPDEARILKEESFSEEGSLFTELYSGNEKTIYWIPIKVKEQLRIGLWIEKEKPETVDNKKEEEEIHFLASTLAPGYGAAWEKFDQAHVFKKLKKNRQLWFYAWLTLFIVLFGVRIPLRVAAPAEVVPIDPLLVTAPLDGIIEKVVVQPGEVVKKGDLLFSYDKRVPEKELNTAKNQVEIARAELDRARTLGLSDPKSLSEVEVLKLKLKKEEIAFDLANIQAQKLDVLAEAPGIVMIEDPEEWSGKPVRIGEKVLTLSDPKKTKLKIWVPEGDNVAIDEEKPLMISLHVAPEKEYKAKLDYIGFESKIGEGEVPAYQAEANWETPPEDVKLGLKGTAILYGENVSLFYFLVRKPWSTFRRVTGL